MGELDRGRAARVLSGERGFDEQSMLDEDPDHPDEPPGTPALERPSVGSQT